MAASIVVVPGQLITKDFGFVGGRGTFTNQDSGTNDDGTESGNSIVSSVAGYIERIDKLISVRQIKSRYVGEVGDLVCGRIVAVESSRWKVDVNGYKDAKLHLSSVNLPGGVQRMRTQEDQLQMRMLYKEGDLISAEIQNISTDGFISLHTRSLKYGKLENGQFLVVPACLVPRLSQHYVSLPWGVDVILGLNGGIWISRSISDEWKDGDDGTGMNTAIVPRVEVLQWLRQKHATTPMLIDDRLKVCRVHNCIQLLSKARLMISSSNICSLYQASLDECIEPKALLRPEISNQLLAIAFK